MKIGLLAMSDNCAERGFISSCHELRAMLEKFGDCRLQYSADIPSLFAEMVRELQSAGTVVVTVSPRHYLRCKKKLIAALGIPAVCSDELKSRILAQGVGQLTPEQVEEHALAVKGAAVFPTGDGLYSGFAVESAGQRIVFLAADKDRLSALIDGELSQYFSRISGIPLPSGEAEHTQEIEDEPEMEADVPTEVPEIPEAAVPATPAAEEASGIPAPLEKLFALRAKGCRHLADSGQTIAFAQTKSSTLLRQLMEQMSAEEGDPVLFSDYTYDRGRENPREYVAHLALGALEAKGADYGAAVSNVFTSEQEMFIYIALSDGESAQVRRLYLQEGERPEQLVIASFCELFQSVEQLADGMTVQKLAASSPVIVAGSREEAKTCRIPKRVKLITGICVGVLVLVCVVMGLCLREPSASAFNAADAVDTTYYRTTWQTTEEPEIETTTLPEETTEEETTQEQSTAPAVPVTQPSNRQEDAGGVGGEEPAEPPVIHGDAQEPAGDEENPPSADFEGTFTITTYGYGHGVGMSQYGANELAQEGWTYDRILPHYYPGTVLVQDSAAGTAGIPSADDIARVVQQEMGSSFEPEALKAQAVAAYTYARNHGNSIGGMSSVSDITKVSEKVRNAVQAVYGQMVTYNGQPINAVFHAMSAGKTADSRTIWGGAIPYLTPVDSAGDTRQNRYQVTTTYTAQEMAGILEDALGVTMGGDPAEWFTILSQDGAVSAEIGYVGQMRIQINPDSYTDISGNYFRENVMGYSRMRSPCFTITYTA